MTARIPVGEVVDEPMDIPAFLAGLEKFHHTSTSCAAAPKSRDEVVRHVEYGMFSDGRLVIEFDDATYTLTKIDKQRLFDFAFLFEVAK